MKKRRILVVEDDRTSRKILTRILESAGYEVVESSEARDAIHIAEMNPPAAMVIDVMLPDQQGTEIVEELRKNPACRNIATVFLTGILAKKAEGANYYFEIQGVKYPALSKPVRKDQLLKLLSLAAQRSAETQKAEAKKPAATKPHASAPSAKKDQPAELPEETEFIEEIQQSPLW